MERKVFLDLETIPVARPDVLEDIRMAALDKLTEEIAAVRPPSNYGAEAQQKWWMEKGDAQRKALSDSAERQIDEAIRKTALDGGYGRVCCVGVAIDDQPVKTIHLGNEMGLLTLLSDYLDTIPVSEWYSTTVVGHNVLGFDLRFLMQRHIVHGIKPHSIIKRASFAKPWEIDKVFDTMVQWAGVGNRISLDKLCKVLRVESPKAEITGANVWDYYQAGKIEEIAEYCAKDVDATRKVWERLTFA